MTAARELFEAWERQDYAALAPHIDIVEVNGRTQSRIDSHIWRGIMAEYDRQEQAVYDMKARAQGFGDWPKLLAYCVTLIDQDRASEAHALYRAVVG